MGCSRSKECDVDFTELDNLRAEIGLGSNDTPSKSRHGGELIDILAKKAKPIVDSMILSDTTPKLSKQVVATTAAVVVGTKLAYNEGVNRLVNIFVPSLDDVSSFSAPIYPKTQDEKKFIREALKTNFVFAACSDRELRTIVDAFEEFHFKGGARLIVEGDVGDYCYVLKTGNVRFEVQGKAVGQAVEGKTFGELALLYSSPRAASVTADTDVTIYRLDQKTFRYIMQSQLMATEQKKRELLHGVRFLDILDPSDINKLPMVPRVFEEGDCISQNGDEIDKLNVIQEGKVHVTGTENKELGPGDHFGETALLNKGDNSEKPLTVVAITRVLSLCIDKDTFERVVGDIAVLANHAKDKQLLVSDMQIYSSIGWSVLLYLCFWRDNSVATLLLLP
jgi:cAMP-dependent protein kinase regulator